MIEYKTMIDNGQTSLFNETRDIERMTLVGFFSQ